MWLREVCCLGMYVWTHTLTHAYTHTLTHTNTPTHNETPTQTHNCVKIVAWGVYLCLCVCMHACMYMHVYMCMHAACSLFVRVYICMYAGTQACIRCVCRHVWICERAHIFTLFSYSLNKPPLSLFLARSLRYCLSEYTYE